MREDCLPQNRDAIYAFKPNQLQRTCGACHGPCNWQRVRAGPAGVVQRFYGRRQRLRRSLRHGLRELRAGGHPGSSCGHRRWLHRPGLHGPGRVWQRRCPTGHDHGPVPVETNDARGLTRQRITPRLLAQSRASALTVTSSRAPLAARERIIVRQTHRRRDPLLDLRSTL